MLKDLVAIVDNGEAARGFIERATAFAAAQEAHLAISLMMDIFDNAAVLPPFDYYPVILDRSIIFVLFLLKNWIHQKNTLMKTTF